VVKRTAIGGLLIGGIIVAGQLFGTGDAHADDQSYLNYLNSHGFEWRRTMDPIPMTGGDAVNGGHWICNNLHAVQPPDGGSAFNTWNIPQLPLLIEAAQHELCPDTLSGGGA
jgi:hypothetical protein